MGGGDGGTDLVAVMRGYLWYHGGRWEQGGKFDIHYTHTHTHTTHTPHTHAHYTHTRARAGDGW